MFHIVLYEPEIPPNTGNIIRLCANTGAQLHLIHPLGFQLEEKQLRRAGLDYRDLAIVSEYANLKEFLRKNINLRILAYTTKGKRNYSDMDYQPKDAFMFGPETRGLPKNLLENIPNTNKLRIPMQATSRSLNLSNAAAIVLYEAWRQLDFAVDTQES